MRSNHSALSEDNDSCRSNLAADEEEARLGK